MTETGISVPEFYDRLRGTPDLLGNWPFDDLVPREPYKHTMGTEQAEGIAVGMLMGRRGANVQLAVYAGVGAPVRTQLGFEDISEAGRWNGLTGVGVALAVRRHRLSLPHQPVYEATRMLAVEPSIASVHAIVAVPLGTKEEAGVGYVHGAATLPYPRGTANALAVAPPNMRLVVGATCGEGQLIISPEGDILTHVQRQEPVRVRLGELQSGHTYSAMGPIYALKPPAAG